VVTIVYKGEVEHRDSTGKGGVIGPGDVQWMTAAGGILHKEFHSEAFTRNGGTLEMVQLWINLPAKHKNAEPSYQALLDRDIPTVALPNGFGTLRVIAGEHDGRRGPAAQLHTDQRVGSSAQSRWRYFAPLAGRPHRHGRDAERHRAGQW